MSAPLIRIGWAPLLYASVLALIAFPSHAQVPPPPIQHWNAFGNFVDLYRQAYQPQSTAQSAGGGGPQTANSNGPATAPSGPADQSSPPQSQGFNPFGGGFGFSVGGGTSVGRSSDRYGDHKSGRAFTDEGQQRDWEKQVDLAFPPTPRDPNYANAPPSPPSGPPPVSGLSQGTMISRGGGADNGEAGLMGFLAAFVTGNFTDVIIGMSSGPPPPMVLNTDAVFETPVEGVSDVVPITGDLGGDVADDIIM